MRSAPKAITVLRARSTLHPRWMRCPDAQPPPRAAMPAQAGLTRFHRTFTFDGKAAFTLEDAIETSAPKIVEWILHADAPFAANGDGFVVNAAPVRLRVRVDAPAATAVAIKATLTVETKR